MLVLLVTQFSYVQHGTTCLKNSLIVLLVKSLLDRWQTLILLLGVLLGHFYNNLDNYKMYVY